MKSFIYSLTLLLLLKVSLGKSVPNAKCACSEAEQQRRERSDDVDPYRAVVDQHSQDIAQLKAETLALQTKLSQKVAFSAHFTQTTITFSTGARVVYDVADLNVGNGYESSTGTFHAPYPGVYVFHIKLLSMQNFSTRLDVFTTPNKRITTTEVWEDDYRQVATAQSLVHLDAGQAVWVTASIINKVHATSEMYGAYYTSFDGFLLYPD